MPLVKSENRQANSLPNSPVELMHFIFNSCMDTMLDTDTYRKYSKIPGLVTMFKNGALKDMQKIEGNPPDVQKVDQLMKRVFLVMDNYYARKGAM